jgi:hypothetical protein
MRARVVLDDDLGKEMDEMLTGSLEHTGLFLLAYEDEALGFAFRIQAQKLPPKLD